jgi:hypothetical protein
LTLVDILSHRSGLPRHDQVLLQDISIEDVVHRLKYLPLTEEVRTSWQYCNLMYVVAAHLIEKTSNQSLYEFFRENLWEQLGMHSTYLDVAPARRDNRDVSEGYWFNPETNETLSTNLAYAPVVRGAGNTLTSVNDYAKWISALLSRSAPISENGYEMLFGAHSVLAPEVHEPFSAPDLYGFGWILQSYKGVQIIQHGGAQVGFGAFVVLIPKMQAGFVILGNEMVGANRASLVLAFEIIDNLLGIEREERFNWEGVYGFPPPFIFRFFCSFGFKGGDILTRIQHRHPSGGPEAVKQNPRSAIPRSPRYRLPAPAPPPPRFIQWPVYTPGLPNPVDKLELPRPLIPAQEPRKMDGRAALRGL